MACIGIQVTTWTASGQLCTPTAISSSRSTSNAMESGSGKVVTADMLENIENPLALATVTWLPPEQGGRRSGPPSAPVYASTTTFRTGDAVESDPGWTAPDPMPDSAPVHQIHPPPPSTV